MAGDKVRNDVLLLPRLFRLLIEDLGEFLEVVVAGFPHLVEHIGIGMLGSHFQMAANMVTYQVPHVLR